MKLDTNCVLTVLIIVIITLLSIYIILSKDKFIDSGDVDEGKSSYENSDAKKKGEMMQLIQVNIIN